MSSGLRAGRRTMDDHESTIPRLGFTENYVRGLRSAAYNNASAYGYSVTITATFASALEKEALPFPPVLTESWPRNLLPSSPPVGLE